MSTELPPTGPPRPRWLVRLTANLSRWRRPAVPPRHLEPGLVAEELLAWSRDDGRWNPRSQRDWHSLLDDVDASWSRLGPRLAEAIGVEDELAALRDVRAAHALITVDHRFTVDRVARVLVSAFDALDAMVAASDDLFAAARSSSHPESLDDETRWRLALLASVGERQGHDWAVMADRIRRALEWTRGQPFEESLEAVYRAMRAPPGRGHSIVWLGIDHAWVWGPSPNPAVELVNGEWLLAVLRNWNGARDDFPWEELASDPERLLVACEPIDDDDSPDERLPVIFARIDLGAGPTAGARERARDTLELLIARASARQGGTNWKISSVCLHFVDGELVFETTGPIGDPDVYDRLGRQDVLQDPTGATIHEEAGRLPAHLPANNGTLHAALQLSQWLTEARGSSSPARLVLSGRIIEQAANWAGLAVRTLVDDHLSFAWAWNSIAGHLGRAGRAAVLRLPGADGTSSSDEERETFLTANRELIDHSVPGAYPQARPWKVLRRLDWLVEQHSPDSETGDYLRELQQRLATGPAAAAWVDELRRELRVRNARSVRTRNAIVHGGPLLTGVAKTVVGMQDTLGSQALEWTIDGLAAERPVPEVFAEYRARYANALERLGGGRNPTVEMIAGASP